MPSDKPTVFIGSSGSSLKVARALKAGLEAIATVTVWDEYPNFQRASNLFLPSLLEAPEMFDFAVMVFGADDRIVTDKGMFDVPRDNVVFELGLFMAHLGKGRTFVIVPTGEHQVKILSDLSGLIWASYRSPEDVEGAVKRISLEIAENCRRNVVAYDGPTSVFNFEVTLLKEVQRLWKDKQPVSVSNYALDMQATWGPMQEHLNREETHDLNWRSVMLDPEWEGFPNIESDSISVKRAQHNAELIQEFCRKHSKEMAERRVTFECRTYGNVPTIHGFLVNDSFLILTLLRCTKDGKVIGLDNSYLRFPMTTETNAHTIHAYTDWFNYAWETSQHWIWPPK